jgi:hypothetical protein
MLEAMARISPSQPNDAMARIASRRNRTISHELESKLFFGRESKLFSKVQVDSKRDWVIKSSKKRRGTTHQSPKSAILRSAYSGFAGSPL